MAVRLWQSPQGFQKDLNGCHIKGRTDLEFANDIVIISEEIDQAQELLKKVETSVGKVGLRMNAGEPNSWPTTIAKTTPSSQVTDFN